MALVINRNNLNQWVDFTDVLAEVPKANYLLNDLGVFTPEYSSQKTIEIRQKVGNAHVLEDRNWDERNQTIAGGEVRSLQLKIPHFPLDDAITPNDVDGQVAVESLAAAMQLESVANVRASKMENLRAAHDLTMEVGRWQLLVDGEVYSPKGTLRTSYGPTVNFYTEFGISRTESQITTFAGTADPRAQLEAIRKAVLAGVRGVAGTARVVALCGTDYFNALLANGFVTNTLMSLDVPLSRQLLLGNPEAFGPNGIYRTVNIFGITFIDAGEAGYDRNGTFVPFIEAKEARFMPVGIRGAFKTYFAPANRFSSINRRAQGSYWYEYANEKDDLIEIMTEQNFLNAMLYPKSVVRSWIA
jgi:hypothetical protein